MFVSHQVECSNEALNREIFFVGGFDGSDSAVASCGMEVDAADE